MSNDFCSKKIIMLTRPYGRAYGMIELVRKLGWPAYNEPIVEIEPISGPVGWSSNLAAIAVTSPNGARSLESVAGLARTIPVFAVGSGTADELRLRGFSNIDVSDGTAQTLIQRLTKRVPRHIGVIAHVSGEHIACDIAAELSARGYRSIRVVVYRANLRQTLTETGQVLCRTNQIGGVICMSKRIAAQLTVLLRKHQQMQILQSVPAVAMSLPIADQLHQDGWRKIRVASEPSMAATLDALAMKNRAKSWLRAPN